MSSQNTKGIVEGFDEDFHALVEDIGSRTTLGLVEFFDYWSEKKFDCIFANRFDPRELLEAIAAINRKLVKYAVDSSCTDTSRILALFFLFCITLKQPGHLRQKLRLTPDNALVLQNLCSVNKEETSTMKIHATFIWKRLKAMETIDFVEEDLVYGPSMLIYKGFKNCPELSESYQQLIEGSNDECLNLLKSSIEPVLVETEEALAQYKRLVETLDLQRYQDSTVSMDTTGTFEASISRVRTLLTSYKNGVHNQRLDDNSQLPSRST